MENADGELDVIVVICDREGSDILDAERSSGTIAGVDTAVSLSFSSSISSSSSSSSSSSASVF